MPSTVSALFAAAGVRPLGAVPWRTPVPITAPGVYVVSRCEDPEAMVDAVDAPIDGPTVRRLLDVRPELRVDGVRPSSEALSARLAQLWHPDEPVVYIGLAGTSLRKRVGQYYRTQPGARSPHAGGWPVKCLAGLDQFWVHFAVCDDVDTAERTMLAAFVSSVTPNVALKIRSPTPTSRSRTPKVGGS
jgi:hypothetical protein